MCKILITFLEFNFLFFGAYKFTLILKSIFQTVNTRSHTDNYLLCLGEKNLLNIFECHNY